MGKNAIKFLIVYALFFCGASSSLLAQDTTPNLKLELINIDETPPGIKVLINTGYALKFDVPVPEAFSIFMPDIEGVTAFPQTADAPEVGLFKISYVGRDPADSDNIFLVENIEFFNFSIDQGPLEERIGKLGRLLAQQVFDAVTASLENVEYLGGGAIKIGELDGVEIIGSYIDPQNGQGGIRIVGLLHPNSTDGIFSVSSIITKFYDLTSPNDLALTATGALMREFTYLGD